MPRWRDAQAWVTDRFASILTWGIVAVSFVLGYASFLRINVSFVPDSRYYLAMAFWFSGDSQQAAHDRVVAFAQPFGIPIPDTQTLFGWGLVQPRVVLPTLAAPFVKLFGPYGLALTTFLITVALTIVLTMVLIKRYGNTVAVISMLLVNGSIYLMLFNVAMLTESLSALWTVLLLIAAWRFQRTRAWWLLGALGLITALSAFTRQATLIDAAAFVMAWLLGSLFLRKNSPWMWPAVVVAGTSVVCQVVQTLVFAPFSQADQFVKTSGADTLWGALLTVPGKALTILKVDYGNFMAGDHALLLLVTFSVIGMVVFFKREESHLLFGAILAVALYNITNGSPSTFRYAVPGLAFYVLTFALLMSRTGERMRLLADRRAPVAE